MLKIAKAQRDHVLESSGGAWPKTIFDYQCLLYDKFELPSVELYDVDIAELVPSGCGRWIVRFDPRLPAATIKAGLVHELSEFLSRKATDENTLFEDEYSGHGPAASTGRPTIADEAKSVVDRWHATANQFVKLWCKDNGLVFEQVMTPKAVWPKSGPLVNFGYTSTAPDTKPDLSPIDPFEDSCV